MRIFLHKNIINKKNGVAYIMHKERKLRTPSLHYLEIIAKAYEKFGFDEEILGEAYDFSEKT